MLTHDEFSALAAQGYNRIPVVREVLSDLDTPLSVYLKLADGPHTYLFESVEGGENWGRHSIIGLPAAALYTLRGHHAQHRAIRRGGRGARARRSAGRARCHPRAVQGAEAAGPARIHRRTGRLLGFRHHSVMSSRNLRATTSPTNSARPMCC
jgi:anthranilate/para-aminobenzoate synthase component I